MECGECFKEETIGTKPDMKNELRRPLGGVFSITNTLSLRDTIKVPIRRVKSARRTCNLKRDISECVTQG